MLPSWSREAPLGGRFSRGLEMTWVIVGAVVVVLGFVLVFRSAWK